VTCLAPSGAEFKQTVAMRYGVDPHEIRVDPPAIMVYQSEGQRTTATITITDRRLQPLRVKAVHSPTDRVHVDALEPVEREDGGRDFPFDVTIVGCEGEGSEVAVAVEVDDPNGRYDTIKLPVTVLSPSRLQQAAVERVAAAAEIEEQSPGADGTGRDAR